METTNRIGLEEKEKEKEKEKEREREKTDNKLDYIQMALLWRQQVSNFSCPHLEGSSFRLEKSQMDCVGQAEELRAF